MRHLLFEELPSVVGGYYKISVKIDADSDIHIKATDGKKCKKIKTDKNGKSITDITSDSDCHCFEVDVDD
jgi:hypothetical protein